MDGRDKPGHDGKRRGKAGAIPARAGIGLRGPHMAEIAAARPAIGWLEALWSIGYGARRPDVVSTGLLSRLGSALPPRALVVLVDAAVPTILQRLAQRGTGKSRLERDLVTDRSADCLARASQVLKYVEDIAWQLSHVHDLVVLRIDNDAECTLPAHAVAIADAVSELLSGPRWLHVSRWVPA